MEKVTRIQTRFTREYNYSIYMQAIDLDTFILSFWGGSIRLNKNDYESASPIISKLMRHVVNHAIKCEIQHIGLIILAPIGCGMHTFEWERVLSKIFCIQAEGTDLQLDIIYSSYSPFQSDRLTIKLREFADSLTHLGEKSQDTTEEETYKDYTNEKTEGISVDNQALERFGVYGYGESAYTMYLDEIFTRRAKEEIDSGRFRVYTTEEKAINNWRREFNKDLRSLLNANASLVSRIESGKSLSTNRRKILYLCWKLHMEIEETRTLMILGKLSPMAISDNEKLLMELIEEKSYNEFSISDYLYDTKGITLDDVLGIKDEEREIC